MIRRLHRDERGQTMAMAVVVMFAMAIMVAVVADIGQVVNRKVALQLVADTGAFTGASKMAEGLNYLAYGNAWMQSIYGEWTYAFTTAYALALAECDPADAVTGVFNIAFEAFSVPFTAYNYAYPSFPYVEARRVSIRNVNELFPGETNQFQFAELPSKDIFGADAALLAPFVNPSVIKAGTARPMFTLADVSDVDEGTRPIIKYPIDLGNAALFGATSTGWTCWEYIPPFEIDIRETDMLPFWHKKNGTDYFVWHVKAPRTKALFFDSLFGGDSIPAMRAVAAAKPTEGSIERGDSNYVAKMVPVRKTMIAPAIIDNMLTGLFKVRPILH